MILSLLLLLQSAVIHDDPDAAPPVPAAAQAAYGAYVACLIEPLEPAIGGRAPATPAARRALVRSALAGCHDQRVATAAQMEARIPRTGAWADPGNRAAKIEEIIGKAEQRASFMIVSPDEYRSIVDQVFKCMAAGGAEACQAEQPSGKGTR